MALHYRIWSYLGKADIPIPIEQIRKRRPMSRLFLAPVYCSGLPAPLPQYSTPLATLSSRHSYAPSLSALHTVFSTWNVSSLLTSPSLTVQTATLLSLFRGCLCPEYQLLCVPQWAVSFEGVGPHWIPLWASPNVRTHWANNDQDARLPVPRPNPGGFPTSPGQSEAACGNELTYLLRSSPPSVHSLALIQLPA